MVTEEQKENIRGFFVHWGWDLIEVGEDHPNNDSDGEEGQVGELNNQILGAIMCKMLTPWRLYKKTIHQILW